MSDILERCRRGDKQARKILYEKFADKAFGLSLRILKEREAAKDAVQQVFYKVFIKIDQFRSESEIGTWIYRITANICFDVLKSSHSKLLHLEDEGVAAASEIRMATKPDWIPSSIEQETRRVLATIDPKWAKTFWLFTMEQLGQKEIAEIQKISVPTVKMRLAKVRRILKENIDRKEV